MATLDPSPSERDVDSGTMETAAREARMAQRARLQPALIMRGRRGGAAPGRTYAVAKRALDLLVAVPLALLALPVALLIALAIYVGDRGPILFTQRRTGKDGARFSIYKFRTMVPDAEARKAELRAASEVAWPDFKMARDPRITTVGRFLRATYLDELPQLINVIKGDMTLVGPRPTSFEAGLYETWQTGRLDVKPGLTGLWQLDRERNDPSFDGRVRMDIRYVRTRGIRSDLRLIWRTIKSMVLREGV